MTRTSTPTKLPPIPRVPGTIEPNLRNYLDALTETLHIRTGRRGDPRDRAITLRELIDSGLAEELKSRPFDPNTGDGGGFGPTTGIQTRPPAPTGFTVSPGLSLITLFWDLPAYSNHSLTEVWRHDSDVLGDATLIGVSSGTSYIDSVGSDASYFYWVRHVSSSSISGPFNDTDGTLGETDPDLDIVLELLTDSITSTQLAQDLLDDVESIDTLNDQYTVKVNVNGHVAGFGIANTTEAYDGNIHSDFIVVVDRFSIVGTDSNDTPVVPFIVQTTSSTVNGVNVPAGTYITDAFIRNGSITTAKIGLAQIDTAQIANAAISTAKIDDAAITSAKIENAAITTAKIEDLAVDSAKIKDLSVNTIKITGNAVSQTVFGSSASATSTSIPVTTRGGTVMLWALFYPTGTATKTYTLKRGGTTLRTFQLNSVPAVWMMWDDAPAIGSHTYTAECSASCNVIELRLLEVLK